MIVPVKIPDLEKNVASKISGRHIAFHRSAQNVIEQDPRNKLKNTPKRSKPRKQSSAVTRRARYVELESLIKHEELSYKYEMFVPLHELWLGYMQELLGVDLDTSHQASDEASNTRVNPAGIATLPPAAAMQAKLLKADYHGALFAVKRAKNPSLVGLTGIVIQESQETFKLITIENQVKIIPKSHCLFEFKLPFKNQSESSIRIVGGEFFQEELVFEIIGTNFLFRPTDRVSRKFKLKGFGEL